MAIKTILPLTFFHTDIKLYIILYRTDNNNQNLQFGSRNRQKVEQINILLTKVKYCVDRRKKIHTVILIILHLLLNFRNLNICIGIHYNSVNGLNFQKLIVFDSQLLSVNYSRFRDN